MSQDLEKDLDELTSLNRKIKKLVRFAKIKNVDSYNDSLNKYNIANQSYTRLVQKIIFFKSIESSGGGGIFNKDELVEIENKLVVKLRIEVKSLIEACKKVIREFSDDSIGPIDDSS